MAGRILTDDGGRALDGNGDPISGAKLKAFVAGTSTPAALYTTRALNVAHASPVVADSHGYFTQMWADEGRRLDVKLYAAADVTFTTPLRTFLDVTPQGGAGQFEPAGTGAVARSAQAKLREIVNATDYGFAVGGDPSANATALQNAVNEASVVYLPSSLADTAIMDATIVTHAGTRIIGGGVAHTRLVSTANPAFLYQAVTGGTEGVIGPRFEDFQLVCTGSGLRLNSETGGFTDNGPSEEPSQRHIVRPRIERVRLVGPGAAGSRGIEWNKTFSGVVDQCEIVDFDIGFKSTGADFTEIRGRTRIWSCGTLVDAAQSGNFGSGLFLNACDLLAATRTFVKSSDNHLIVSNCYFEANVFVLTGPAFDLSGDYMMSFTGNRIEISAAYAATLLKMVGECGTFVFENNGQTGYAWGAVSWNTDNSALYYKNAIQRQKIMVRGNSVLHAVPFQTIEPEPQRNRYRDLWVISPGTAGLIDEEDGVNCRVRDGAFALPADLSGNSIGSRFMFKDVAYPLTATVNVRVRAKATVAGQQLTCAHFDGASFQSFVQIDMTTSYAWYTFFSSQAVVDGKFRLYNTDTVTTGDILVSNLVVERA